MGTYRYVSAISNMGRQPHFCVSDKVPPPPGVAVAARRMIEDENDEVQYGDRIPYVIVRGEPNTRLVDRAVAPQELLNSRSVSSCR
jgi:DNA polymerase elongation subunit (family B)